MIDFVKKYGRRELERFAYLRVYKTLSCADMRKAWQDVETEEMQKIEEFIQNNPKYKRWLHE